MARTKAYERQILNQVANINHKMLEVERTFGIGSEQQQRYVNAITAALPSGSYHMTKAGGIRINKDKANAKGLMLGQLEPLRKLPTAKQSLRHSKRAQAKQMLRKAGVEPTEEKIREEALSISDQEALEELAAKSYIEAIENEDNRLNYDESIKEEMQKKGAKTYTELKELMEKGEKARVKRERHREAGRRYRQRHREDINRRQRERRAAARAAAKSRVSKV